ncbi:MAG: LPS export ABC transporter periplasmic protein LptC [candidate division WOR-3 bacterium]
MKNCVIATLLVGGLIVIFLSCQKESKSPTSNRELPSQIIRDFKFYESVAGRRLYDIQADSAYIFDKARRIDAFGVSVLFYNKNGTTTKLEAQTGSVNMDNANLVVRGQVIVQTADSSFLYTDSLFWDNSRELINTDAPVKIISTRGIIEGTGLITNAELERIEIKSQVTGKAQYEFK